MGKQALPTNLSSEELRDIAADVRQRSLFSARTNNERYLEDIRQAVGEILNPKIGVDPLTGLPRTTGLDTATARLRLKEALDAIDYIPDADDRGTIKDLSSDQRINLVLRTNTEQAQSEGRLKKLEDPDMLAVQPAFELVRFGQRLEPRDWVQRFRLAGELSGHALGDGWTITPTGRMVATVRHPLWEQLGNSGNFNDALDTAYPPFAFNSGMDWLSIDIDEAEELGIVKPFTPITA